MIKEIDLTTFEMNAYGMSEADMLEQYGDYAKITGTEMFVAGLLSDCQEMIGEENEAVRKTLNMAKFFLFKQMKENRSAE